MAFFSFCCWVSTWFIRERIIWDSERERLRRCPAKSDNCYNLYSGTSSEFEECGRGKKGEVRAQLERRAEKMSVFNLSRLRDVSTEIKCVLSSLIYWILRLTQQVCCLNFRVMRPSPMACACCRIIQVWGKQGFVRIGQIAWKSLKNSHLTLLFPWLNILIWKAVFLSP